MCIPGLSEGGPEGPPWETREWAEWGVKNKSGRASGNPARQRSSVAKAWRGRVPGVFGNSSEAVEQHAGRVGRKATGPAHTPKHFWLPVRAWRGRPILPEVVFPGLGRLALAGLHWTSYTTVRAPGVFGPSLGRGCCVLHLFLCFVLHFAESFKEPQPNLWYRWARFGKGLRQTTLSL